MMWEFNPAEPQCHVLIVVVSTPPIGWHVGVAFTPKGILGEPVQKVFSTGSLFLNRFTNTRHDPMGA